ncbi:MAG TPA: PAS domain S-box protein [Pyrinomonadaceae bacterium]|nr:PAS domain S-box protein [Pyrinomonadaceae bacterium]HMP66689.1 PAS domain S-box protein [Pyrinomonadaceae bacterium]
MTAKNKASGRSNESPRTRRSKKGSGSHLLLDGLKDESVNYRSFIENLPVLFYVVSPHPPYSPQYVSPAFKLFGYPLEDWTNDPEIWLRVIHPEDRERVFDETVVSTKSGEHVDYEYRVIDAAGRVRWVRDRGSLIRDDYGNVIYREGVMLEVTVRKRTEAALRESEEQFRRLFENANDIIYVHDLDGNYISMNKAAETVFGYTREEALKMNMAEIAAPDQLAIARNKLLEKINGRSDQTAYEIDCLKKDGSRITLEVNSTIIRKDGVPIAVQGIARDVTERKQADEALRESEIRYRELFENANDLIYTHDLRGNFTSLNRAGERITGYAREEAVTMNITQVVAPESLAAAREMTVRKLATHEPTTYEIDIIAKEGRRVSLELSTRLIMEKGKPIGVQGIGRDITERRRAEDELKLSERRFRQLGEGIYHQVWTADPDGRLDYVNNRTLQYFGKDSSELLGEGWAGCVHPDDLPGCLDRWRESLRTGKIYAVEFRLRRSDGAYRWHRAVANPGSDADGNIIKWYGTNTDIDDQKRSEEMLNYFARHDSLTGLPNRTEFMRHLRSAIDRANAIGASRFAVLFLDLDRFKVINDSLGHIIGDKLLTAIADRLNSLVRPGDVVARLGGDEFTILLNRTGDENEVVAIADRVQKNLGKPFDIDGYEVFTSASIGIILSDHLEREPEDYLRDADSAMYRAKESGKARYEVFDREMHVRNLDLLRLETDLRRAVANNGFQVVYQPIVDLFDGTVTEFEALLRWNHPERGLISPEEFVTVAEETGLIVPIGHWILQESCRQLAEWQKQTVCRLSVSVNLSARELMHPSLIDKLKGALDASGIKPSQLKLEVTENTVMEQSVRSMRILRDLRMLGFSLATDDFGTGYSSLSYLEQFPFDRLKIDRTFIDKMNRDERSESIVKTILMLGENLGIEVVAEGIETDEQLRRLQLLGCRIGQGYLFSAPVNAEIASKLIGKSPSRMFPYMPDALTGDPTLFEVTEIQ